MLHTIPLKMIYDKFWVEIPFKKEMSALYGLHIMESVLVNYYKDRKCAVNKNSSLRIVASVHYHAREIIL